MAFRITVHHALTDEIAPFARDRRYAVPRLIHASATDEDLGLDLGLEVEIGDRGEPRCRQLEVRATGEDEVTGETLRRVPVARLLGLVLAVAAWKVTSPTTMQTGMAAGAMREFYQSYARGSRRPRRGSPLTDANLRQVAELYRAAFDRGDPPTATIAGELHIARSTAARWVAKARERGLLGPSIRGRAGEAES